MLHFVEESGTHSALATVAAKPPRAIALKRRIVLKDYVDFQRMTETNVDRSVK